METGHSGLRPIKYIYEHSSLRDEHGQEVYDNKMG
jgi:hypothetical protein